jgi:Cu+-exporting ATPase
MGNQDNNSCVHCGADCGKHPVVWNNQEFCCNGCKTVYQLLNENKLFNYYTIDETPGIKVEIREKLISFSEGRITKVKFFIPVIHCTSCIWLLEKLHRLHPGIKHAFVNFSRKEVDVTFDESAITLRQVVELLSSIHYIPDLSVNVLWPFLSLSHL